MINKIKINRELLELFKQGNHLSTSEGDNYYHYPFILRVTDKELGSDFDNDDLICEIYEKDDLPSDITDLLYL